MCQITYPNNLYELVDYIDIDPEMPDLTDPEMPDLTDDEFVETGAQGETPIDDILEETIFEDENPAEDEDHHAIAEIFANIYRTHFFERRMLFEPELRQ